MKPATPDSKYDDEARAAISAALKGKKRPQEVCEKIRQSKLGKKRSPEVSARIAAANRGKKRSPEVRAKMAEARKRYFERLDANGWEKARGYLEKARTTRLEKYKRLKYLAAAKKHLEEEQSKQALMGNTYISSANTEINI